MRAALLPTSIFLSLALSQGGCAATWAAAHWQELPFGNGFQTDVTPLGEQQRRVQLEVRPHDPAPHELVPEPEPEPEPEPLPAPPTLPPALPPAPEAELVGPPYGTHPLRLSCTVEQRAQQERHEQRWAIWDVGEKGAMGLVGLFEVMVAAAMIHETANGDSEQAGAEYAVAAVLAADALGLFSLMALTRPTWQSSTETHPGRWRPAARACPPGLSVVVGDVTLPVDTTGQLDANDEAWLVRELVRDGGALELRHSGRSTSLAVAPATLCRWALDRRLPAPLYCDPAPRELSSTQGATLPLPPSSVSWLKP